MTTRAIHALSALAMLALSAPMAQAQAACAPRDKLTAHLAKKYGEALTGGGLRSANQVLEIWSAEKTGTWTAVLTDASGRSCILATGTNWHQQEPTVTPTDVPS